MMCPDVAGAIPCELVNFHTITTIEEFHARLSGIINHVFGQCAVQVKTKWAAWLTTFHSMIICPINECLDSSLNNCDANAQCIDRPIGYECACREHYVGDGRSCSIKNYCAIQSTCSPYSTCTPGFGGLGYRCPCKDGFTGADCLPVDPCLTNNGGCHAMAVCESEIVGYNVNHWCKCKTGWYGSGKECLAIDPCANHNCDPLNGICHPMANVVQLDDYDCSCRDGFVGNGFICTAYVNPCLNVNCASGAQCVVTKENGLDQASCQCLPGYTGDGFFCQLANVCETADCHPLATCQSFGSTYTCSCPTGMIGDGKYCEIPDPCLANPCHISATCSSLGNGQYSCNCNSGYQGDGMNCNLIPAPTTPPTPSFPSPEDFASNADYLMSFINYSSVANVYAETPGCLGKCGNNATCMKALGYSGLTVYQCVCNAPYIGDGFSCRMGKSCTEKCHSGTVCRDGTCVCIGKANTHWYHKWSRECRDINECNTKNNENICHENATCTNSVGSYSCKCKDGFIGDGVSCFTKPTGITSQTVTSGGVTSTIITGQISGSGSTDDLLMNFVNSFSGGSTSSGTVTSAVAPPSQSDFGQSFNGGTDVYAVMPDGQCSIMGYNWASVDFETTVHANRWISGAVKDDTKQLYNELMDEFQRLGRAVLTRSGPACDLSKAGKIDCRRLYFPKNEHKCQMIRRIEKVGSLFRYIKLTLFRFTNQSLNTAIRPGRQSMA